MLTRLRKLIPNDFPLRLWYLKLWTFLGALRYGFPGKGIPIIGITGTDGKTTTVFFTMQLLRALGRSVGMASTVGFQIGDEYRRNSTHRTSLGRFGLMNLFREFQDKHLDIAVVEVSSHGLVQGRLDHIDFSTAVITNLSREHLDYHKTMEGYAKAKEMLFKKVASHKGVKTFVVYKDFEDASRYLGYANKGKLLTFSKNDGNSDMVLKKVSHHENGMKVTLVFHGKTYEVELPVHGEFNILNMFAAMEICYGLGYRMEEIITYIPLLQGPPGRMERVAGKGRVVYIDYAVTPKALTEMYTTLEKVTKGKLIAILGACGDRDQGKRPEMGAIATSLCDHVIFTNEEPYTEDPRSIISMLEEGAKKQGSKNFEVVIDRKEAIARALTMAEEGDVVVLSGMGDQDSMIVGTQKIPWNDRVEVERVIKQL